MKHALSLGSALFGLALMASPGTAQALPLDRNVNAAAQIELAAFGCRRGWAPDRWGRCRPIARHRHYPRPRVFSDTRPAPMWRQNLRERAGGCAYVRTPRGMVYRCD